MTKRLVLTLLFGMATMLLSSCDSGNRGNAPTGPRGIPPGKTNESRSAQKMSFSLPLCMEGHSLWHVLLTLCQRGGGHECVRVGSQPMPEILGA